MNESLKEFFELIPLGDWIGDGISAAINWLVDNASPFFDAIRWPIAQVLDGAESLLLWLPWPVVILLVIGVGWLNAGRWVGIGSGLGLILVGFLGYWDLTMTTMSMILTALAFCIVVGVPLGILAAKNDTFENTVRPILDGMQTIHPFVYLIPIVMFFGIGQVPGTMATIIFALPPIVRLTNLGIRQVPKEVVEAGRAFGSNGRQLLFDVQLPLAMPTIMAGLNQTLMLALSMVVIVALIAGGGLGQEIYGAVTSLQIGRAITSGLAVLVLAIVLDRISQVRGVDRSAV
jgi:glycine betaine/proline transport system permease protein